MTLFIHTEMRRLQLTRCEEKNILASGSERGHREVNISLFKKQTFKGPFTEA